MRELRPRVKTLTFAAVIMAGLVVLAYTRPALWQAVHTSASIVPYGKIVLAALCGLAGGLVFRLAGDVADRRESVLVLTGLCFLPLLGDFSCYWTKTFELGDRTVRLADEISLWQYLWALFQAEHVFLVPSGPTYQVGGPLGLLGYLFDVAVFGACGLLAFRMLVPRTSHCAGCRKILRLRRACRLHFRERDPIVTRVHEARRKADDPRSFVVALAGRPGDADKRSAGHTLEVEIWHCPECGRQRIESMVRVKTDEGWLPIGDLTETLEADANIPVSELLGNAEGGKAA